jgi:hypothetical protein
MIINVDGQNYDIVNWGEFKKKLLNAIAFQIVIEVQKNIKDMNLIKSSNLWQSIQSAPATEDSVEIFSDTKYASYLEFGTLEYFEIYGLDRFKATLDPKKKDLSSAERLKFPAGCQPFAIFRRVLYNENKMKDIIERAVRAAQQ